MDFWGSENLWETASPRNGRMAESQQLDLRDWTVPQIFLVCSSVFQSPRFHDNTPGSELFWHGHKRTDSIVVGLVFFAPAHCLQETHWAGCSVVKRAEICQQCQKWKIEVPMNHWAKNILTWLPSFEWPKCLCIWLETNENQWRFLALFEQSCVKSVNWKEQIRNGFEIR